VAEDPAGWLFATALTAWVSQAPGAETVGGAEVQRSRRKIEGNTTAPPGRYAHSRVL
jgi:hypothetical protein